MLFGGIFSHSAGIHATSEVNTLQDDKFSLLSRTPLESCITAFGNVQLPNLYVRWLQFHLHELMSPRNTF